MMFCCYCYERAEPQHTTGEHILLLLQVAAEHPRSEKRAAALLAVLYCPERNLGALIAEVQRRSLMSGWGRA
jgi:hypothetical protein